MAAVQQQLLREGVRLLTLTGPGGVGKTRLGLHVAAELTERFTDGTWFVSLAPVSDPDLVIPTIAQTLGMREEEVRSLLDQLQATLHEKQVLLLLDNFEHVASAATHVADLLGVCPRLKVLATSRETLHVRAEHEFPVPALALPDPKHLPDLATLSQYEAVALFIERAQAVKPDFQVTDVMAPAVAEICVRLDGLPLAIELAAARIKLFPPHALLARLGQRLAVLTGGARDAPARQKTLRDTIAWSYDLLDAHEQRLFRRLSVFVGGCTLEAVEAVCTALGDAAGQVVDGVASLIDKSLLQQTELEGEEPRFVMLETIREYGLEALVACGEMEATQHARAVYYLTLAEEAEARACGPTTTRLVGAVRTGARQPASGARVGAEPGLDEEVRQRSGLALHLAGALREFWIEHAHLSKGRNFLERAIAGSREAAPALRARALIAAADVALVQVDHQRGEALAEEGLVLYQELGDSTGIAWCLYFLGVFATGRGEYTVARSQLEGSLTLFRELGNKERQGWSTFRLGMLDYIQCEYLRTRAHYEEALALFRDLGHMDGVAEMLVMVGQVLQQGDLVSARSLINEGLMLSRKENNQWHVALALNISSEVALSQDNLATARSQAEEALKLFRELGMKSSIAWSLSQVARMEARQGNYPAARSLYAEILTLARETDDKTHIAFYLEDLAEVVAAQGEFACAARLWGAAKTLRTVISSPLPPASCAGYECVVAAAHIHLGEQAFAAAWAEGGTMTLEQALSLAQRVAVSTPTAAEQPATPTAKPSSRYPAGLTTREVEVLRLVAQGLTDAEVVEQLVISLRTVNWHLTSIYSKLGVSSRAAATHYAMEHRLV